MSEARMMGSLADRLLSFVSTTPERDANYDIAVTLLKHYPQLKGMTLGQIANLCYTFWGWTVSKRSRPGWSRTSP